MSEIQVNHNKKTRAEDIRDSLFQFLDLLADRVAERLQQLPKQVGAEDAAGSEQASAGHEADPGREPGHGSQDQETGPDG